MSNHLSKSLFSIPRLKKSRSRQQNQPENPTSLCLNALTADDAFLRFAAAPDKPFFSPRSPERNFIIFLCIPLPPRLFHPQKAPKRILFLTLHIPPLRAPFFTLEKPQRELFFLASPICRGLFHPRKAPKRILFLTLNSPSAATFFIPMQPRTEFYFLTLHPFPSVAARGSRAALQYFRSYRPPFTTRGTGSPNMPNTSNDRARNALRSAETEKFSRPQTLRPPHIGVQGRPYKMNTRKNCIHRRGGRRGIISGGNGSRRYIIGDYRQGKE